MAHGVVYSASEEMKVDSEQEGDMDGVDPWKAAMQGDLDALLQYIDDGGDVNQRDRDNNTPLHWACQESHFDIVGVLMSRNAAVDPVNDLQSTPLHYACREGNLDIVTGLINFNANLEARNKDNLSPLHVAAGMGHIEVTKRLLENGAHMEAEDNALYTPLWRAAYYGHPQVVEVLLAKGANQLARNKKGRKPGDVFSPMVDEEKKERIKALLGIGPAAQHNHVGGSNLSGAPGAVTSTANAPTVASSSLNPGGASRGGVGDGAIAGVTVGSSLGPRAGGGNGVAPGGSHYGANAEATNTSSPPAYKHHPPPQERREPQPSAASIADSSYLYPDPSPANSPSSMMLNSTATVMSEAVVAAAIGDAGGGNKAGIGGGRLGNGESSIGAKAATSEAALVMRDPGNRAVAGVQTTPSVNGSLEINQLKAELALKNQQLEQLGVKLQEYKDTLVQAQKTSTRELDDADVQAEMDQKMNLMAAELERKKKEIGEARREIETTKRTRDERIAQLQQDLEMERTKSGGCSCTIS